MLLNFTAAAEWVVFVPHLSRTVARRTVPSTYRSAPIPHPLRASTLVPHTALSPYLTAVPHCPCTIRYPYFVAVFLTGLALRYHRQRWSGREGSWEFGCDHRHCPGEKASRLGTCGALKFNYLAAAHTKASSARPPARPPTSPPTSLASCAPQSYPASYTIFSYCAFYPPSVPAPPSYTPLLPPARPPPSLIPSLPPAHPTDPASFILASHPVLLPAHWTRPPASVTPSLPLAGLPDPPSSYPSHLLPLVAAVALVVVVVTTVFDVTVKNSF